MSERERELLVYAVLAAADAETERWSAGARTAFRAFLASVAAEPLLLLDGATERERAANARAVARYWYRNCQLGDAVVDEAAPRLEEPGLAAGAQGADETASSDDPGAVEPVAAPLDAEETQRLRELMERLGATLGLRLWRRARKR